MAFVGLKNNKNDRILLSYTYTEKKNASNSQTMSKKLQVTHWTWNFEVEK